MIGRDITLEGRPFTVIGIVPASFQFMPDLGFSSRLASPDLWTLLPAPREPSEGASRGQCAVCRLLRWSLV